MVRKLGKRKGNVYLGASSRKANSVERDGIKLVQYLTGSGGVPKRYCQRVADEIRGQYDHVRVLPYGKKWMVYVSPLK